MSASIASNNPQANVAEQSRMELQAKLNGLGGLGGRKLDPETKAKKLREACEGFESIFIQKMWQEMRNTVPKSNLLSGKEEKFWQDMYDQELSKSMTKAGGIGLADMMYEQLSRNLVDASRGAANGHTGGAFIPSAAPLVTEPLPDVYEKPMAAQSRPMPSIYEGEIEQKDSEEPAIEEEKPMQEKRHGLVHAQTHTRRAGSQGSTMSGNNGIDLAYRAKREAGDKLSASAVRPSMQPQRKQNVKAQAKVNQAIPEQNNVAPVQYGTEESLQAALELAKTGAAVQPQTQEGSLSAMVAQAKSRNAANMNIASASTSQGLANGQDVMETVNAEPVVRKTRYTTNIPSKTKKAGDAIRMLNVDNVSVNSKQGKGLAAYHAAQEQAAVINNNNAEIPAAPIPPLTQEQTEAVNFTIPPLKSSALNNQI